jgi:hypothetical protein
MRGKPFLPEATLPLYVDGELPLDLKTVRRTRLEL